MSVAIPASGFLIPYAALSLFYWGRFDGVFTYMAPFDRGVMAAVQYGLYLLIPVVVLLLGMLQKNHAGKGAIKTARSQPMPWLSQWVKTAVVFILLGSGLAFSLNRGGKTKILTDYHACHGNWDALLGAFQKYPVRDELMIYHVNRALYHKGQMAENLFSYPQFYGPDGLLLSEACAQKARIQTSDLWFELGHVNNALRWAHEAMSMRGETTRSLQRIADINILKRQKAYANISLALLNKKLFNQDWISTREHMINKDFQVSSDARLSHIKSCMPQSDFIISTNTPTVELKALLDANPGNRMAFEYLMAYYLLNRQVGDFVKNLDRIRSFPYPSLPRHYKEALIFYQDIEKNSKLDLSLYTINQSSRDRYNDFILILKKFNNNKSDAHPLLKQRHGNTYWYYLLYSGPAKG